MRLLFVMGLMGVGALVAKPEKHGPEWFKKTQAKLLQQLIKEYGQEGEFTKAPLAEAIWLRASPEMIEEMLEARFSVNTPGPRGLTPLQMSVRAGIVGDNVSLVKKLLKLGAQDNINHKSDSGKTALDQLYAQTDEEDFTPAHVIQVKELIKTMEAAGAKRASELEPKQD